MFFKYSFWFFKSFSNIFWFEFKSFFCFSKLSFNAFLLSFSFLCFSISFSDDLIFFKVVSFLKFSEFIFDLIPFSFFSSSLTLLSILSLYLFSISKIFFSISSISFKILFKFNCISSLWFLYWTNSLVLVLTNKLLS